MQISVSTSHSRLPSWSDRCLIALDSGLRTVFAVTRANRPSPATGLQAPELGAAESQAAGALMRVNHVGEICAQALYQSQALFARSPAQRQQFEQAAQEELDHLAWTAQRVTELGTHTSHLAPLWWAGAFAWGSVAGLAGDRWSLGFVVETERQVEAHLASHLDRLPEQDVASRAIVDQMKHEEAEHANAALAAGALPLPPAIQGLMRAAATVMTTLAHRI
ncbi:MAG: 2-polyprenyl-3-methyl-6-methoxy-1,4-benzoquinone monooxygenase [Burkholderiales bacterium]|nr:2-polyprenyl-3-methyl-6-methoxy-1,4-benzoquinone monooxygenase [Burkholderiales bacterium]